ncbi:MAG: cysteine desulfurase [Methanobrevibacter sp.]|jgi:cysteine desulfurase|nr:cysteine desulfurase [Methanobrevibacter sp.]
MIYLDNAATTQLNNEIKKTINKLYDDYFMNADSPYYPALKINNLQVQARGKLANLLNVKSEELIFTSSGSEANNMAIKGIAFKYLNKNKHIITSITEHSSVYEAMKQLETFGFEITYLKPNKHGHIENKDILATIKDNTILISIMKINSEIGAINNLEDIYDEIKKIKRNIIIHIDFVQALGKYDIELNKCDLASFSAHKINGVKGSGLLYKKNNVTILPLICGGQQEFHLRAGTSNYYYNIVFPKTLRLYLEKRNKSNDFIKTRFLYLQDLLRSDKRIKVNSSRENNSYHIINFSIPNYKSEVILNALEEANIYLSTKAACSSNVKRSRVIDSLPIDDALKNSAFRVSLSLETTNEEIDSFFNSLINILNQIKTI